MHPPRRPLLPKSPSRISPPAAPRSLRPNQATLACLLTATLLLTAACAAAHNDAAKDGGPAIDTTPADAGPSPSSKARIRIVAANLTSGKGQSYDPGEGARILQGLAPDIVLIQEFNAGNRSRDAIKAFIDQALGAGFYWYREPKGSIPNGIISRWPLLDAGYWEDPLSPNREFAWARIDIPGAVDLWAVSLHLLTSRASTRTKQANVLLQKIQADVPEADFLIIGGDLNTRNNGEQILDTLEAQISRAHRPRDRKGNPNTNAKRKRPYDWLLPDADLEAFHDSVRIGDNVFPHGLIFDSRVYTPLSDVKPVEFGDSGAVGMQHMAVVRDFVVPVGRVP